MSSSSEQHNKSLSIDDLTEDYATTPVPSQVSVSGIRMAMINTSMAFSIPGLLTGALVGTSFSLNDSLIVFVAAGLILTIIGFTTGLVGIKKRLSTYMLIESSFGKFGSRVINLLIALSLTGWFGVNLDLFAVAGSQAFEQALGIKIPVMLLIIFGGILMTGAAIFGFKSIQWLSAILVPFQIVVFCMLMFLTLSDTNISELYSLSIPQTMSIGEGISAVVGSFILSAVVMPDYTRFGKSSRDAVIASVIPFLIAATFVYIGSALAGLWTGKSEILQVMLAAGLGMYAFILIIFSGTVTNAINVYCCSLSLSAVFHQCKGWVLVIIAGMLGTILASLGMVDNFINFIIFLGIIFTPVAAIFIVDGLLIKEKSSMENANNTQQTSHPILAIIAWFFGMITAYSTEYLDFQLTQVSSLDSMLTSFIVYWSLLKFRAVEAVKE